jgi:hypothetical protein
MNGRPRSGCYDSYFPPPLGFPEWYLAKNGIPPEREHGAALATSHGINLSIRLKRMWEDSIDAAQDLQALLMSCKLYRNPVARAALLAGFESGHTRQTTCIEPQRLSKTLTTAAEAHFRMELYYCLSRPCFSHQKSQASYENRMAMWRDISEGVEGPRRQRRRCLESTTREFKCRGR